MINKDPNSNSSLQRDRFYKKAGYTHQRAHNLSRVHGSLDPNQLRRLALCPHIPSHSQRNQTERRKIKTMTKNEKKKLPNVGQR